MKEYNHSKIEKKWQKMWDEKKTYATLSAAKAKGKKPFYVLDMFPYPSGAGLHVGHPRGYIGSDVLARQKRMQGFNVLHPMGYDAFGLPAEQYAVANKIHPRKAVEMNVKTFEKQLGLIGLSYDWSRKVNTTDPEFYKWTQWIFLKIFDSWFDVSKNKARPIEDLVKIFEKKGNGDVAVFSNYETIFSAKEWNVMSDMQQQNVLMHYRLAYEGNSEVNWCPHLSTVLANDEIVDSPEGPISERGGYPVVKKSMRQWFMRITAYGERLLEDLEGLEWSESIKEIQKNWIGKSTGSEISFPVRIHGKESQEKITVFTTRADTLFGVAYVVLAPEHPFVAQFMNSVSNKADVEKYIADTKKKDDIVRTATDKEKTGVELKGITVVNPANGEIVPVWIADYVLGSYGTGAVMAVPAHDERDFLFANKFNLPLKEVIIPLFKTTTGPDAVREDMPFVKRETTVTVVKHWEEEKYIGLKWKTQNWKTFVVGGTDGEPIEIASVREVTEETGYQNPRFISKLGRAQSQFFASHKNENRWADVHGVYVELENGEHKEIKSQEKKLHEVVWMTADEISNFIDKEEGLMFWNNFLGDKTAILQEGFLINSGKFDGMNSEEARKKITEFVGGKIVTKYKFRDAIFARQRYWGEPIPLQKDKDGIIHEVSEKKLPLTLPNVKSYEPTGTGESPLASVPLWKKGGYETNTMPGWAGSSWYFLRYIDPKNKKAFADGKEISYWFPKKKLGAVDVYVGGSEHATGHLMYSRFWHKVLFDYGLVTTKEPFQVLKNQGMILATDGRKMSKRWGNVINPDEIVATYGADTLRLYEMFMGPFEASLPWSTESIIGSRRFIERVFRFAGKVYEANAKTTDKSAEMFIHRSIKKVTEDIANFSFNTAVSNMMICLNEMEKAEHVSHKDFLMFVQILAPFAPYVTEDIWEMFGEKKSIHISAWPKYDEKKTVSATLTIAIQVNGKLRATIEVDKDATREEIESLALHHEKVIPFFEGRNPQKVIYVLGRLVNFVV